MFILIISSILVGIILYDVIYRKFFAPLSHLPQPWSWPLVYHMPYLVFYNDHFGQIAKFAERFKEEGLFKFGILSNNPKEIVMVVNPQFQKQILLKPDIFPRLPALQSLLPLIGDGLLTAKGELHRFQKKLLGKAFSTGHLKHFIPVFNKHAGVLVERLRTIVKDFEDGQNLIVKTFVQDMSFDIIGEIGFGFHFNSQTTKSSEFVTIFRQLSEGVFTTKTRTILNLFKFMRYVPFGPAKKISKANEIGRKVLDEILSQRKEKIKKGDMTETEKNDLLSMMIEAVDGENNERFTDQILKDNSFTFLFAGHETTATGIPGVIYHLAMYPDLQEKAREEVNTYLNGRTDLTFEDMTYFPYLTAFTKEAIRLFNPIPFILRRSVADFKFGKYDIPKGSVFFFPNYHVNKDENTFDDATKFIPERYLDNSDYKNGTSFTFGYGPYGCIGKNFALHEMKVALVRLLQMFRFSLDPGYESYYYRGGLTLKTTKPMKIRVKAL